MKEIKTRGSQKQVHALDKTADLASKMKQGLVRSKDQFQNLSDDGQVTPEEYAQDKIKYASEDIVQDTAHATKDAAQKTYDGSKRLVEQIKQKRRDGDSIKQTAKSTGKQSFITMRKDIKTAEKSTNKSVKTAEKSARTTIKTTEKAAKTAEKNLKASQKAAKASAKAAKKSAEAAKKAAEATARTVKAVARATAVAVKAIVSGIRNLIIAIAAGGWVAVVIIIVITVIALIVGSCFGLFYSFGDSSDYTLQNAISEIHSDYLAKIEEAKQSEEYDLVEMQDCDAHWKEVLAVYAVKTSADPEKPQDVVTMDESKFEILESVFWDMHEITKDVVEKTVEVYSTTVDEKGNIITTVSKETKRVLQITVKHPTIDEMQGKYGFNEKQKEQLEEMLFDDNAMPWDDLLSCV